MFDQLKAMGAVAALLKDKERLRQTGEQVKATLDASRVIGEAGGGAVRVTMSGRVQVIGVELDPALAAGMGAGAPNRAMAESLISEATNQAIAKAQALMQQVVSKSARELGLPEMPGLAQFMGG